MPCVPRPMDADHPEMSYSFHADSHPSQRASLERPNDAGAPCPLNIFETVAGLVERAIDSVLGRTPNKQDDVGSRGRGGPITCRIIGHDKHIRPSSLFDLKGCLPRGALVQR